MTDKFSNIIEKALKAILDKSDGIKGKLRKTSAGKWIGGRRAVQALIAVALIAGVSTGAYALTQIPKEIKVVINENPGKTEETYETTAYTLDEFIEEEGIDYDSTLDKISANVATTLSDDMTIVIDKPIPVYLTADGETLEFRAQPPILVSDVLEGLGKEVGEEDILSHELDEELEMSEEVILQRVTYGTATEEESIAYSSKTIKDYDFGIGQVAVTQEGENGVKTKTYKTKLVDGVEVSREFVSEEVTKEPVDQITSIGYKILSGTPSGLSYSKAITCKAVAYHSSAANPRGASGKPAVYGTCAVDTSVIPMGTKLYITGYGYATANDTGSGVKGNMVDLYMENNAQCYYWGARTVTVYILG